MDFLGRSGDAQCDTQYVCTIANGLAELGTWRGSNGKAGGSPQPEFCPEASRNPGTRDDRIVFRRGHELFEYPALGEFFGAAARGVSEQAGRSPRTPVESQTEHKNEYDRA